MMFHIYIGFNRHNSIVFRPPPPQIYCSPSSSSSSSSSSSTILLFSLLLNSIVFPPPPQFYCSPSSSTILLFSLLLLLLLSLLLNYRHRHHNSLKSCKPVSLVQSAIMSQVVKNNRGFLQLLAHCPTHQCEFLLMTATPQQVHALFTHSKEEMLAFFLLEKNENMKK